MKKLPAEQVYLALCAFSSLLFTTAFVTGSIYRLRLAELNPLQLVLVGTTVELAVFLFEIPTGVVADLRSRRLSVILGYATIGAGLFLEGAVPRFGSILLAQVVWGTGFTLTSGAQDAWLADEVGEEALTRIYLRGAQVSQLAAFLGVVASIALAYVRLNLPLLVSGLGFVALALFLHLVMPETGFRPLPHGQRTTWQKMGHTFAAGLRATRRRPLLVTLMAIGLLAGLSSEGIDRLWEAHFLTNFTFPAFGGWSYLVWFGVINFGAMILTLLATEWVRRRSDALGHTIIARYVLLLHAGTIAGLVAFGLSRGFMLAVAAWSVIAVTRQTTRPLYAAWVNRGLESSVRATVLSTVNQMDSLGQVVGGPLLGALATRFGLRAAMLTVALWLFPVLGLDIRAKRQGAPVSRPAAP